MRRTLAGLMAAAIGTSALVAGVAAPTVAVAETRDDGCYVQLDAPTSIKIDRPYKDVKVSVYDSCGVAEYASFDLYGSAGWDNIFIFDGNAVDHWDVYDDWQKPGRYTTRLSMAYDSDYNDLGFEPTTTTVKLGTKAYTSTKRSGKKVTIKVGAKSYAPDHNAYRAWNASSARIQYKSGSTWKTLKTVKLKKGAASYSYKIKSKRTYRFVIGETSTRFGATSSTSRR
jgi:hypothetical protein